MLIYQYLTLSAIKMKYSEGRIASVQYVPYHSGLTFQMVIGPSEAN